MRSLWVPRFTYRVSQSGLESPVLPRTHGRHITVRLPACLPGESCWNWNRRGEGTKREGSLMRMGLRGSYCTLMNDPIISAAPWASSTPISRSPVPCLLQVGSDAGSFYMGGAEASSIGAGSVHAHSPVCLLGEFPEGLGLCQRQDRAGSGTWHWHKLCDYTCMRYMVDLSKNV